MAPRAWTQFLADDSSFSSGNAISMDLPAVCTNYHDRKNATAYAISSGQKCTHAQLIRHATRARGSCLLPRFQISLWHPNPLKPISSFMIHTCLQTGKEVRKAFARAPRYICLPNLRPSYVISLAPINQSNDVRMIGTIYGVRNYNHREQRKHA